MEVKEMTIADVLKTPAFYNNLKVVISDLENIWRNARISANAPLKRHPIDRLLEKGVFEPGQMTVLYASAMDKKLQGYSSSERKFILEVGGEAFNITMKQFVDQEKKDNSTELFVKCLDNERKTMRKREITATGMINNNGGLQMYFGELNQFFAMHKGSRIIARFTVASPGSSEALKGYYFNYVVPTFRSGIWEAGERLTEEQTERRLRELSPVMYEQIPNIETGEYETRLRKISELSNAELIEHIEHLKQIAAEEYSIFIDDPKSF